MINLQNIQLENEVITIDDRNSFNAIGKTAVLNNCIIKCQVPAKCLSICGTLKNSTIIADRLLKGFSWTDATLVDCTFQGAFKENTFGTTSNSEGLCKSGVFVDADLDDCDFYGTLDESHRFPSWPNFVILHPHQHAATMREAAKTDGLSIFADSIQFLDEEATAMALNANAFCKRSKESIETVRSYFSQFDFVKL